MNGHSSDGDGCTGGGNQHHEHHQHHSHAGLIDTLGDCRIAVTGGAGRRIIADLKPLGIEVYIAPPGCDAETAMGLLVAGQLPAADEFACGCGH